MSSKNKLNDQIPQIVAIIPLRAQGSLKLKKAVLRHLGLDGSQVLYLNTRGEIKLSLLSGRDKKINIDSKNRIHLAEEILKLLGTVGDIKIALLERDNAVALKAFHIREESGECARFVDIETTHSVIRKIETNPMPEQFVPSLFNRYKNAKLRYDVHGFLKGRQTLEAWQSRRILNISEISDKVLKQQLIGNRLKNQQKNGSWQDNVPVTAKNLRELAELGMTKTDKEIRKALDWLMDRPESRYNPGIWFATDELVLEQADVIKRRQKHKSKGPRERFNQRKALETNLVRAAEPLAKNPCGPRIIWTTALVMEALIKLGCERLKRVQRALHTLTIMPMWCDNTYQHGLSDWKRTFPLTQGNFEKILKSFISCYKYGGICNPQDLSQADISHQPFYLRRVAHHSYKGRDEYLLRMPEEGQGCNIIMVRALSRIKNDKLRKILELYLWKFAAVQNFPDGTFSLCADRLFTNLQVPFLQIFSSYNHPVSKVVILRSLPWIIKNQNKDGSWGTRLDKDVATYAVLHALSSLGDSLPSGFFT